MNKLSSIRRYLDIVGCDALENIDVLVALKTVGTNLEISDNGVLVELGLDSLNKVEGTFEIMNNPALYTYIAIQLREQLEAGGGIGGRITIEGNKEAE